MQYQPSRKTLVPSNRKFHQGRIAIFGSLVVLSLFMLVFGITSTTAQTGQDARCADFTGQAHGLCTAAVSEGCFDGVESQECDDLTTNWNERCRVCDGTAPWGEVGRGSCPCVNEVGTAVSLNARFETFTADGVRFYHCGDFEPALSVAGDGIGGMGEAAALRVGVGRGGCGYSLITGPVVENSVNGNLSEGEIEDCREDVRLLMEQIDCP